MRVQIKHVRRLRRPYPPDTHDDVHVLAKVGTLRKRGRLYPKKPGRNRGPSSVRATLQDEEEMRTVAI